MMRDTPIGLSTTAADQSTHRCSSCYQARYCLPHGLDAQDVSSLDEIMRVSRTIRPGRHLFHAGDPLKAVYAVRSGCFKTTIIDCDGNEHVTGFHLPSELVGLEAVYSGRYPCSAIALTSSRVCVLPYHQLMQLAADVPALLGRLFGLFSKDIGNRLLHVGDYSADERLASFFLGVALRQYPRGRTPARITLPMSRTDIANYLQLAPATLSRILASLQRRGIIKVQHRTIHITNLGELESIARRVPAVNL